jgi:hypothetical protein
VEASEDWDVDGCVGRVVVEVVWAPAAEAHRTKAVRPMERSDIVIRLYLPR